MIFIGDISIPNFSACPKIINLPNAFREQSTIANLEGTIIGNEEVSNKSVVFNSDATIKLLNNLNVSVVTLANNHITDIPERIQFTCDQLNHNGIQFCGYGQNLHEARKGILFEENGVSYLILNFCWDITGGIYATSNSSGINPLEIENIEFCLNKAKKEYPKALIVLLMHWNYELEKYPIPMHREMAKRAIDCGADIIIGHHPHCVNGFEYYKGKPIFYSLGNFCFTQGFYMNGRTSFPDYANRELALEISGKKMICHWFNADSSHGCISYEKSEVADESVYLKELSNFNELSDELYIKWFMNHRVKTKALPVFRKVDTKIINKIKKTIVFARGKIIAFLWDKGIRKKRSGIQ